jgi:hypothetical protein
MSILVTDGVDVRHIYLWKLMNDPEKRADVKMSGLLQVTAGYLIIAVPTALVRGVFDAMHEPGISLPGAIDGGALRAGIVVMTPDEVQQVGGADKISERGRSYTYHLGELEEASAVGWPGVSACWHLRVRSPELGALRRSYGLPTQVAGESDFSIVVACRKTGVLASNATSKVTSQSDQSLPGWTFPGSAAQR